MSPVIIPNLQLDNKTGNVMSVRCFGGKTLLIIDRIKQEAERLETEQRGPNKDSFVFTEPFKC